MLTPQDVAALLARHCIAPTEGAAERLAASLNTILDHSAADARSLDFDTEPSAYVLARAATADK